MKAAELLKKYREQPGLKKIAGHLTDTNKHGLWLKGMAGSSKAVIPAAVISELEGTHLFILNEKEQAAYFHNDLENLFGEKDVSFQRKKVLFFPTSYKKSYDIMHTDSANALERSQQLGNWALQYQQKYW